MASPDFIHVEKTGALPGLLLLHGTGGDEGQLLPLAEAIAPGHATLGVRGKVLENGMPRFFRRTSMFSYDVEDIRRRTDELADWLGAGGRSGDRALIALGYSNGANLAAAILLLRPEALAGAILLRANLPLETNPGPSLDGLPVLLINGVDDPYSRPGDAERLVELLEGGGARVEVHEQPSGHELTRFDLEASARWFANVAERQERPA